MDRIDKFIESCSDDEKKYLNTLFSPNEIDVVINYRTNLTIRICYICKIYHKYMDMYNNVCGHSVCTKCDCGCRQCFNDACDCIYNVNDENIVKCTLCKRTCKEECDVLLCERCNKTFVNEWNRCSECLANNCEEEENAFVCPGCLVGQFTKGAI